MTNRVLGPGAKGDPNNPTATEAELEAAAAAKPAEVKANAEMRPLRKDDDDE